MDYVLELEVDEFVDLVKIAIERDRDEDFFAVWTNLVPVMNKDTYVSFEEYRNQLIGGGAGVKTTANVAGEIMSDEEAIEDAESIIKMLELRD